MSNVYMLRANGLDGVSREAGKVYEVDPAKADELVSGGYAVKADFPTLDNYRLQINRAVESYKAHADRIDKNAVMSPHERQYKIAEARAKLDETVEKLKADYQTELKALQLVSAQSAFKTEAATPEAQAFVDGVLIQLRTSDPDDVAELIKAQLPIMDGPTKTELLRRYDDVMALAGDKARKFDALSAQLRTGDMLQYKVLTQIGQDSSPSVMYDQLTKTHRTYKPGYLAQEVYAQFRSDREYEAAMAELRGGEQE
ncbi:hypothetical protein [Paenibacillus sp. VMFN-D1]|uniref:hypothetical protein n=1 Tax=Paenibacillus sp. VMFN-D1 TaxID=2135608 RepID=UPI000E286C4C|nr:hypothetical protein [Paenibacillus sp. VMFN-D1]RED32422.1 hypothetical protein C7820_5702 [Paenibacillus sp. VMFN-D1]